VVLGAWTPGGELGLLQAEQGQGAESGLPPSQLSPLQTRIRGPLPEHAVMRGGGPCRAVVSLRAEDGAGVELRGGTLA
jgi:hypothetical protein